MNRESPDSSAWELGRPCRGVEGEEPHCPVYIAARYPGTPPSHDETKDIADSGSSKHSLEVPRVHFQKSRFQCSSFDYSSQATTRPATGSEAIVMEGYDVRRLTLEVPSDKDGKFLMAVGMFFRPQCLEYPQLQHLIMIQTSALGQRSLGVVIGLAKMRRCYVFKDVYDTGELCLEKGANRGADGRNSRKHEFGHERRST
ncbi:unnamed protein product [Angiostrongylus costaricensis]|uniref:Uncharacterized protein n=1 Tax=Angiostrongylus costaricensis TaxID=334426 RepID=A0A0R3PK09_ANGCS|nr:unnamed protein product [Angiostrongylus costaricensis]